MPASRMWQAGPMGIEPAAGDGPPQDRLLREGEDRGGEFRESGDAWTTAPDGRRFWGRFGAAGLLAFDPRRGVLLQHRAGWSHHGGTWALPGGARHRGESASEAALREAAEEAGVPAGSIRPRLISVLDLGVWTYSTLVADVVQPFEPVISDPESLALEWVPAAEVESFPLHPSFADSWPDLRALLDVRPVVVVDAANVIGSVPDGWWKDRAGAAARLIGGIDGLQRRGMPAGVLGLPEEQWFPEFVVVLEGAARNVAAQELPAQDIPAQDLSVHVIRAEGSGDDAVVGAAEQMQAAGRRVTVATSDRELADRSRRAGAAVISAGRLRGLL